MTRQNLTRSLIVVAAVALLAATAIQADDRVLLRATGAPANVLVILDSGALMTFDPTTSSLNFPAAGDDDGRYTEYMKHVYGESYLTGLLGTDYEIALNRGSKLTQAKRALRTFFNTGFEFNFGFSYYNKKDISQAYHNYIYQVKEMVDSDGDGVDDTSQPSMLDETPPGGPIRFGSDVNYFGNKVDYPPPAFPVRFGIDGTDTYTVWDRGEPLTTSIYGDGRTVFYGNWADVEPDSFTVGSRRIVSYLVDSGNTATAQAWSALSPLLRKAGSYYYYPAYDWDQVSGTIQNGLNGITSWTTIATNLGLDTSEFHGQWKLAMRDIALTDIQTRLDGVTSNQIGTPTTYIREDLQVYDGSSWSTSTSRITEVEYVQHFGMYDHFSEDDVPAKDTLSAFDQQGTADCTGYTEVIPNDGKTPFIGISQPAPEPVNLGDPPAGAIKDQTWLIDTTLEPQTMPVFYFPDHAAKYVPTFQEHYIPATETVIAFGRRPIKDTIVKAGQYWAEVDSWDDPLANCRMNFLLLITDGKETCAGGAAVCSAADNYDYPIYTIYLGDPAQADEIEYTDVECIAERSGGKFFPAGNEQEMVSALMKIAMDIEERTRGFASPIVPSVNSSTEQTAYLSTFTPKEGRSIWRGHLRAYLIDPTTGVIADLREDGTPDPWAANWDAGDTLAVRDADDRNVYFGIDDPSAAQPGQRKEFEFSTGNDVVDIPVRTFLGEEIFPEDGAWLDASSNESQSRLDRLESVVNFIRGVEQEVSASDSTIVTVPGRDPNRYGWCSFTEDYDEDLGTAEPCSADGAELEGIEKLGDIFHSTPQLMARPSCFPCWYQNLFNYRDDPVTSDVDDGFVHDQRYRRQVLFAGADDGTLHAFEGGLWDVDGATIDGEVIDPMYDMGTGRELFAWVPAGVMDTLDILAYGGDHQWTVDGTPTIADVFVDPDFASIPNDADREWRTVVLFGERRGGHSYVALDVTDPTDSISGDLTVDAWGEAANSDRDPSNADVWPTFKWEFFDRQSSGAFRDEDAPTASRSTVGNGVPDLGQTWSRPLVGFFKVDADGNSTTPADTKSVMIVGGGYHPAGLGYPWDEEMGNFIYGIDVETGNILFKHQVVGMVPSEIAGTDIDFDGYLETLYWGTTAGYLYKMDVRDEGTLGTVSVNGVNETRVTNWAPEVVFTAPAGQPFFMRPAMSPVGYNSDGSPIVALAIGTGNRDNIMEPNPIPHRFYVIVDRPTAGGGPILEADLTTFTMDTTQVDNASLLDGYGWALVLYSPAAPGEDWEKVNTAGLILEGYVIFSTFNPSSEVKEVPIYGGVDNDGDGRGDEIIGYACRRGGNARTYIVSLYNSNPQDASDRFIQHDEATAMATEPVVYLGADGKIHVIQALDNLKLEEPVEAIEPRVAPVGWKED